MAPPNPYLLAADNPTALLALLRSEPPGSLLAHSQDEHGYTLLHAAASYNHLDLLRALATEFGVPPDLRDEDGETALFVVETPEAARVLVEELGLDPRMRNFEGLTPAEKMESEGEWPEVVAYYRGAEERLGPGVPPLDGQGIGGGGGGAVVMQLPPAPEGLEVTVGTMSEAEVGGLQPDPEFRRRIEELAARDDFQTPEGQAELRRLVEEAISGEGFAEERNVRPR